MNAETLLRRPARPLLTNMPSTRKVGIARLKVIGQFQIPIDVLGLSLETCTAHIEHRPHRAAWGRAQAVLMVTLLQPENSVRKTRFSRLTKQRGQS